MSTWRENADERLADVCRGMDRYSITVLHERLCADQRTKAGSQNEASLAPAQASLQSCRAPSCRAGKRLSSAWMSSKQGIGQLTMNFTGRVMRAQSAWARSCVTMLLEDGCCGRPEAVEKVRVKVTQLMLDPGLVLWQGWLCVLLAAHCTAV